MENDKKLVRLVEGAKADVRMLAKTMPHVLPQWQAWQAAEDDLRRAKQMRDAAFKDWVKIKGE